MRVKRPLEEVNAILNPRGFKIVGEYTGVGNRHKVYCSKHNEVHETAISNILYNNKAGIWCCRQAFFTGPSSPHYNKNLTQEERESNRSRKDYSKWKALRKKIYERDWYTCQSCLSIGGRLNAHHIFNWSNNKGYRLDPCNLITLCENCHKEFHSLYGYKNTTALEYVLFRNKKNIVVNNFAQDLLERIEDWEDKQPAKRS